MMEKEIYNAKKYRDDYSNQNSYTSTSIPFFFENKVLTDEIKLFPSKGFHFKNCVFNENLFINDGQISHEIIFENCTFKKSFNLNECKFEKNVKFWQSSFNRIYFHNTTFNGLADFWSCTFNENVIFYKTDFLGTTVFSAATFKKAVLFTYTSISKVIIFRGTKFENGLDLSQAILSGNISLHDIKINFFKAVDNTDDNKIYENYITETGEIPFSNKRETYRILKQAYSKNGNEIDSLKYRRREHNTLFYELLSNIKRIIIPINKNNLTGIKYIKFYSHKIFNTKSRIRQRLHSLYSNIQNLIILSLNNISNNFGVSWVRGLLFIIIIGGIFFLLSITEITEYHFTLKCWEWESEHLKYFLEFLNPTHKFDYIQKEKLTTKFYFFDFFGRILVGYGIYQFVQAFRKYK